MSNSFKDRLNAARAARSQPTQQHGMVAGSAASGPQISSQQIKRNEAAGVLFREACDHFERLAADNHEVLSRLEPEIGPYIHEPTRSGEERKLEFRGVGIPQGKRQKTRHMLSFDSGDRNDKCCSLVVEHYVTKSGNNRGTGPYSSYWESQGGAERFTYQEAVDQLEKLIIKSVLMRDAELEN